MFGENFEIYWSQVTKNSFKLSTMDGENFEIYWSQVTNLWDLPLYEKVVTPTYKISPPPSPTTPTMFCQTSQPPPFKPPWGGGGHYEYRQHKGTSHSLRTEACHLHKLEKLGGPRLTLEGHHILKYPE